MKLVFRGLLVLLILPCSMPVVYGQAPDSTPAAAVSAAQVDAGSAGGKRAREFQGDDLSQVLRLLARQAKISLVMDEAIKGNVTMRLENVSAMEAMEVLVRQYKLSMHKDEIGVYSLSPPAPMDAALDLIAKPETANRVATYKHNLYTALIKEGFTPEDSLKIVVASDPLAAAPAADKGTAPSSPK